MLISRKLSLGFLSSFFIVNCSKLENREVPADIENISTEDRSDQDIALDNAWKDLASALGIENNQADSREDLIEEQKTAPTILDESSSDDYDKYINLIKEDWQQKGYLTQCAGISEVKELHQARVIGLDGKVAELDDVKVFQLKYKLQKDFDGTADDESRSSLVIMPDKGSIDQPLIVYSHGGSGGLSYSELMQNLNTMQKTHIIVAPSFPGEPICKGKIDSSTGGCDSDGEYATAIGTPSPFDKDIDEVLGLHNCLFRAYRGDYDGNTSNDDTTDDESLKITWLDDTKTPTVFSTVLNLAIPAIGTGWLDVLPQTILTGHSRGGLVALLALAKAGIQYDLPLSNWNSNIGTGMGKNYVIPGIFNCANIISAPTSLTMGRMRQGLEHLVKGTIKNTTFDDIPLFGTLETLFDDYRNDPSITNLNRAIVNVIKRDPAILSPFVLKSLRNWATVKSHDATGERGALLLLQSSDDEVVSFDQTSTLHNLIMSINQSSKISETTFAKAPGVNVISRAFLKSSSASGDFHGGGSFFLNTFGTIPKQYIDSKTTDSALVNSDLEESANSEAVSRFSTKNPTEEQLRITRNYVAAGAINGITTTISSDGTISEKAGDPATGIRPSDYQVLWRRDQNRGCGKSLLQDTL